MRTGNRKICVTVCAPYTIFFYTVKFPLVITLKSLNFEYIKKKCFYLLFHGSTLLTEEYFIRLPLSLKEQPKEQDCDQDNFVSTLEEPLLQL